MRLPLSPRSRSIAGVLRPGASGLPYYCTPPVTLPDVIGGLAVWLHNNQKNKTKTLQLHFKKKTYIRKHPTPTRLGTVFKRVLVVLFVSPVVSVLCKRYRKTPWASGNNSALVLLSLSCVSPEDHPPAKRAAEGRRRRLASIYEKPSVPAAGL